MGFEIEELVSGFLYNAETGEKIMDVCETTLTTADEEYEIPDFKMPVGSFTFTIQNSEIYEELFKTICGDWKNTGKYTVKQMMISPKRTHKRKRIAKKWLKRFGLKIEIETTEGYNFVIHINDIKSRKYRKIYEKLSKLWCSDGAI